MDELTELALAASRGDRSALERFVQRSQADVYRFCLHLAGVEAAEELTQDTYERAIPALARFRGDSSVRTWILAIARRAAADRVRREIRQRRVVEKVTSMDRRDELVEDVRTFEVSDLLGRLDLDRREAFVLTQLLGYRYAEAAEVLGCPVGTVRSRVARARADLQAMTRSDDADISSENDTRGNQATGSDDY